MELPVLQVSYEGLDLSPPLPGLFSDLISGPGSNLLGPDELSPRAIFCLVLL